MKAAQHVGHVFVTTFESLGIDCKSKNYQNLRKSVLNLENLSQISEHRRL